MGHGGEIYPTVNLLTHGQVVPHEGTLGVHPDFVVEIDFEITVDQQTKAHDRTFEGVPDFGCPLVPTGQPRPYLVNYWLNFAKSP